jgi:hypothetical protein
MSFEIEIIKTKKNSSLHWSESVLKKLTEDETAHQIHVAIRYDLYYMSYCIIQVYRFLSNYTIPHHASITFPFSPRFLYFLIIVKN